MAKLTINQDFGLDMRDFDFSSLYYGVDYRFTSSIYRVSYSNGMADEFRGTGFKYTSEGEPTAGTVKSYAIFLDGERAAFIDGVSIKATDIVDAARTYSTSDDVKIISRALSGNDAVTGGDLEDVLYGYDGKDNISGRGGNDRLYGGAGNDKLTGGLDADKLYGGAGADTFVFRSFKESTVAASGRDKIYDFSQSQKDKIDLHLIDASSKSGGNQAFKFIGDDAFNGKAGELRYEKKGGDTLIHGDINGDGAADFSIALDPSFNLKSSDFIL